MPRLLAVVEGEGDQAAVPGLLTRALHRLEHYDWFVAERDTMAVGGLGALRHHFGRYAGALRKQRVDAVLVLLDSDDGCPVAEARELAGRFRAERLPFPVAVVLARREFEAWLLASLETIAPRAADLPDDAAFDGDPEIPRDCKALITGRMPAGRAYSPTRHQAAFARLLDFDLAAGRSRSFRRLLHAVEEVAAGEPGGVTP